jgi:hypothetical protein
MIARLLILKKVEPYHELERPRSGFRYTTRKLVSGIVTMIPCALLAHLRPNHPGCLAGLQLLRKRGSAGDRNLQIRGRRLLSDRCLPTY